MGSLISCLQETLLEVAHAGTGLASPSISCAWATEEKHFPEALVHDPDSHSHLFWNALDTDLRGTPRDHGNFRFPGLCYACQNKRQCLCPIALWVLFLEQQGLISASHIFLSQIPVRTAGWRPRASAGSSGLQRKSCRYSQNLCSSPDSPITLRAHVISFRK